MTGLIVLCRPLAVIVCVAVAAQLVTARSTAESNARALAQAPEGMFERKGDYYMYQGDMLLTPIQAMAAMQRKMIIPETMFWPKNVNYVCVGTVDKALITKALVEWTKKTCMTFTEIEPPSDKTPYLKFEKLDGCYSYLGKLREDGGHTVSLADNCGLTGAIHEIGHALGMHHEQSRSDRDEYVKILKENIDPKNVYNFDKAKTNQYGVPYDFYSMMQYGAMFFSTGGITIRTLDPRFQLVIGTDNDRLSFMDAKMFNLAYKCIDDWVAKCPSIKCQNGGFVQYGTACRCECPEGTSGDSCETKTMEYNDAILSTLFPDTSVVTSPGSIGTKNNPEPTNVMTKITKVIKAPKCKMVALKFVNFDIYKREDNKCSQDYMEIRSSESPASGLIYCGTEIVDGTIFKSEKSTMIIHFKATNGQWPGFKADVTFEDIAGCS